MTARFMQDFGNRFLESRPEMIHCPNQPGLLKISKEACVKRTLAGRSIEFSDSTTLLLSGGKSLSICRRGRRPCHRVIVISLKDRVRFITGIEA